MYIVGAKVVVNPTPPNEYNDRVLKTMNIKQWQDAGYTGKGVNVLVFELLYEGLGINPELIHEGGMIHAKKVMELGNLIAPRCEKTLEHYRPGTIDIANKFNKYQIVTKSLNGTLAQNVDRVERNMFENGTLFLTSAGNKGEEGLTWSATRDVYLAVGAVTYLNSNVVRSSSSSIGKELDVMAFTNMRLSIGTFTGTSCACPMVSFAMALYYEWHFEKYGRFPTPMEARKFIVTNTVDLESEGHDIYTGWGLFVMPDLYELNRKVKKEIVYTIGNKTRTINGVSYDMDVEPIIINNRTYMPSRYVAEDLGATVEWDAVKRQVIVTS